VDPNSRMIDDSGPAKPPAGDETAGDESTGGFPWRSLLLPAVLFVLVLAQTATVAVKEKAISPYDEIAHFDYVVQLQQGNFPVPAGQRYSEEAIQTWACRPVDRALAIGLLCGEPNSASDPRLVFDGVNYEARYGPVYYALAAGGSSILSNVGVSDLTGARLVSSLLYALGAALLLLVAQRMAFSSLAAGGVILAASSTGLSLSQGATVTPDSMAFLITAAVIASALLSRTWRSAVLATTLVCTVAGLTHPVFILIAVLGSVLLLLRWVSLERPTVSWRTARRLVTIGPLAALPVVLSAAASLGWQALAASRNTTGLPADGDAHLMMQSSLGLIDRLAEQLRASLHPDWGTAPGPAFTVLDTPLLRTAGSLVVLATLGACLWAWLWRTEIDYRSVIALRSVAFAIPVSAAVLVVTFWAAYEGGHTTASRYAIPFLAAASVGLGASISRRTAVPMALAGAAVWLSAWVGLV